MGVVNGPGWICRRFGRASLRQWLAQGLTNCTMIIINQICSFFFLEVVLVPSRDDKGPIFNLHDR